MKNQSRPRFGTLSEGEIITGGHLHHLGGHHDGEGHWYAPVLYKRFLTPFCDGIWNRRQVSVGDRGSFPHDPKIVGDRPSWHTGWGKMSSCAIGRGIETQPFPFVCTSHMVNPRKTFPFLCISHTVNPRSTSPFLCTSHTFNPW